MTNAESYETAEERTEAYKDFCRKQPRCLNCPAYREETCAICYFVWLELEAPKEIKVQNKTIENIIDDMHKASTSMDEPHRQDLLRYADRIEKAYKGKE